MFNIKDNVKLMIQPIIWSNILYTLGPILTSIFIPSFAPQYKIFYDFNPLRYALSYDAIIFVQNDYTWEPQYAFLPVYVYILKFLQFMTSSFFTDWKLIFILLAIIMNKLLVIVNVGLLMNFARHFHYFSEQSIKTIGILFLFNPAALFYHSLYSEPIFVFLTVIALTLAFKNEEEAKNTKSYIKSNLISLILFSISTMTRTISMLYSLVYGIPIIAELIREAKGGKFKNCLKIVLSGTIVILLFVTPFIIYLIKGYFQFCSIPDNKSFFCDYPIPNIYSSVETAFWGVSFMNYQRAGSRVLEYLSGTMSLVIVAVSFPNYMKKTGKFCGLILSLLIVALIFGFYSNIQPGTRFVSTNPLFYFNLAYHLRKKKGKVSWFTYLAALYYVGQNVFAIFFFPARHEWC